MSNKNRYNGQVSPTDILTKTSDQKPQDTEQKPQDTPVVEEKNWVAKGGTPVANLDPIKKLYEENETVVPQEPVKEEPKQSEKVKEVTPVKTEEPVVTTTVNPSVQQKTMTQVDTKAPDAKVAKLDALLKKYQELVQTKKPSESTRLKFVESFYAIAEYVLASDSYAVFNRFFDFFLKEKNALVHRNLALAGVHTIRDAQKKSRVTAFFAVFYAMVRFKTERKPFGLSIRAIRLALKNDKFCNWIQAKLNNRG